MSKESLNTSEANENSTFSNSFGESSQSGNVLELEAGESAEEKTPRIVILKLNTLDSRLAEARKKEVELLPIERWHKEVIYQASDRLNFYREKLANKKPIDEKTVKLNLIKGGSDMKYIICGDEDGQFLPPLGFIINTGELYVDGYQDDLSLASTIVHEMTHYYTGQVHQIGETDEVEALTELIAMDIFPEVVLSTFDIEFDEQIYGDDDEAKKNGLKKELIKYSSYREEIEDLLNKYQAHESDGQAGQERLDERKRILFQIPDHISWNYPVEIKENEEKRSSIRQLFDKMRNFLKGD